jgi:hypothetical protein
MQIRPATALQRSRRRSELTSAFDVTVDMAGLAAGWPRSRMTLADRQSADCHVRLCVALRTNLVSVMGTYRPPDPRFHYSSLTLIRREEPRVIRSARDQSKLKMRLYETSFH